jgi:6-phosphogluconolactonase
MTTTVVPGKLVAAREKGLVAVEAASRLAATIRAAIAERQGATLALSGGNTPRDAYALLAREPGVDWSRVHVFWVDERAVAPTDERSNYHWAKVTLLDPAAIKPDNVHRMTAERADLEEAARDYEQAIRAHVSMSGDIALFDVMVLGIGDDGHTASLFPGEATVDIHDRLVATAPAAAGREARMTLTAKVIEHARHVLVLAVGAAKRPALERVWDVQGDLRHTPARVIRACRGEVTWIVDRAAAGVD